MRRSFILTTDMALLVTPAMNMNVLLADIEILRVLLLAVRAPMIRLAVALTMDMAPPGLVLAFRPVIQMQVLLGAVITRTGPGLMLTSPTILWEVALTMVIWPLLWREMQIRLLDGANLIRMGVVFIGTCVILARLRALTMEIELLLIPVIQSRSLLGSR